MSQTFVSKITQKSEHGRNKIIPQSKFVKVFMKQKLKCYFLLTLGKLRLNEGPAQELQ